MLKIRNGHIDDFVELSRIENECFPPTEAASDDAMQKRLKTIRDTFFVAELDGKIVGLINGPVVDVEFITDDLFDEIVANPATGGYQTILGIAVDPKYQEQGIAGELLKKLEQVARASERKGITLTCKERLIPYYEKFGYENKGVSASEHGGVVWYNMVNSLK